MTHDELMYAWGTAISLQSATVVLLGFILWAVSRRD